MRELLVHFDLLARRRLPRWVLLAAVLMVAGGCYLTASSHLDSAGGVSPAQQRCLAAQDRARIDNPDADFRCEDVPDESPRTLAEALVGPGAAMLTGLVGASLLVGATSVGADMGTGFVTTQLFFEPRRRRLLAYKSIAAGVWCFVATAVLAASLGSALAVVYGESASGAIPIVAGLTLRTGTLAAVTAAFGAGLAAATRSTGAVVAVVGLLGALEWAFPLQMEAWARLLPSTYVQAWLSDGSSYSQVACLDGACHEVSVEVSMAMSVLVVLGIAALTWAGSVEVFRRRDLS